jgi:hypothetical protein
MDPGYNPTLMEMYHFRESVETIREGLGDMMIGLQKFEAGIENLRVLFERIDNLALEEIQTERELMRLDYEELARVRSCPRP